MFRRLAALNEGYEQNQQQQQQNQYSQNQNYRFNTLIPNLIPSTDTAPNQLMTALQGVNPMTGQRVNPITTAPRSGLLQSGISNPQNIFYSGWTTPIPKPPPTNRELIDKCNHVKSCADLADPMYKNMNGELICGFCPTSLKGVPIDSKGMPLFTDAINGCMSVITDPNSEACKPKPTDTDIDNRSNKEELCTPNANGFLSATCLLDVIQGAGCSNKGSIALALSNNLSDPNPSNLIMNLEAAKLYNQRNQEDPFTLSRVQGTNQTRAYALSEFQKIRAHANNKSSNSAIDAAARDLCLNKGDIMSYDFCTELGPDSPITTMNAEILKCLQKEFLKHGGTPRGKLYPSKNTLAFYQSKKTYGEALRSMFDLNRAARGAKVVEGFESAYEIQRSALNNLQGIVTEVPRIIPNLPVQPVQPVIPVLPVNPSKPAVVPEPPKPVPKPEPPKGVEIFWYSKNVLISTTVEPTVPIIGYEAVLPSIPSRPTISGMIALTDVYVKERESVKFYLGINKDILKNDDAYKYNNYNLTLNQALDEEDKVDAVTVNREGNFLMTGANVNDINDLTNRECWFYQPNMKNVLKIRWKYAVPARAWAGYGLKQRMSYDQVLKCLSGGTTSDMKPRPLENGILTREIGGPFLMMEVVKNTFADRRLPEAIKAQLNPSVQIKNGSTDVLRSPVGSTGYLNLANSTNATCSLPTIFYTAWRTCLFVFRINTVPVSGINKLCSMTYRSMSIDGEIKVLVTRSGNAQALLSIVGPNGPSGTSTIDMSKWYVCVINRNEMGTAWNMTFYEHELAKKLQALASPINLSVPAEFGANPYMNYNTVIGGSSMAGYDMDLAIWHFFNTTTVTAEMISKSCADQWIVTV